MKIRNAVLAATLTGASLCTATLLAPTAAGAAPVRDAERTERTVQFCANLQTHKDTVNEHVAQLQARIDDLQQRLTDRLAKATEAGATETVAVIEARLDRLASIESKIPTKVAELFARADAFCARATT